MNISIEEMPREIARLEDENERLQEQLKRYKKRDFISKPENIDITETMLDTKDSMYQKLSLYSNELEDRVDELNNLNGKISLALESAENRIDKAIKLIEEDYFEDGSGENIEKVLEILKGE